MQSLRQPAGARFQGARARGGRVFHVSAASAAKSVSGTMKRLKDDKK